MLPRIIRPMWGEREREKKSEMKEKKNIFLKLQLSKLVQIQADGFHRK